MRSASVVLLALAACAPPVVRDDPAPVPQPTPIADVAPPAEAALEAPSAAVEPAPPIPGEPRVEEDLAPLAADPREIVLAYARKYVGKRRSHPDCSHFVRDAFLELGIDVFASDAAGGANGVRLVHRFVEQHGRNDATRVAPGDLVYFDDTWDKNRNRRVDDPLTHVGIVESLEPDGTIFVIHRSGRGVVRDPMNLARPADHKDETGRTINAYLRSPTAPAGAGARRLMGELFAGFGRLRLPTRE